MLVLNGHSDMHYDIISFLKKRIIAFCYAIVIEKLTNKWQLWISCLKITYLMLALIGNLGGSYIPRIYKCANLKYVLYYLRICTIYLMFVLLLLLLISSWLRIKSVGQSGKLLPALPACWPLSYKQEIEENFGLWTGSAVAIWAICGVNQQMGD